MKNRTLRNVCVSALLLAAIGYVDVASGVSKAEKLGTAAGATDLYQITCSDNGKGTPFKLSIRVLDRTPVATPIVSIMSYKGALAVNSADAIDGDATYSPTVYINGGAGAYNVTVYKTAAGMENYTLYYRCLTSAGVDTGTSLSILQNQ